MHSWTRENVHVEASRFGVVRLAPGEEIVHPFGARGVALPELDFFAVSDREGRRLVLGREGRASTFTFEEEGVTETEIEPGLLRAVLAMPQGTSVACAARTDPDGRTRAALYSVAIGEDGLSLERELGLPPARRVAWPGGIWADDVPWPEENADPDLDEPFELDQLDVQSRSGAWRGRGVRMHASPLGLSVSSDYSGIVAVFDPVTLEPRFAVRLPTQWEADHYPCATRQGVVVTTVVSGRESAVLHVAPDGEILGHLSRFGAELALGLGEPFLLDEERICVGQELSEKAGYVLRLPDLKATKSRARTVTSALAQTSTSGSTSVSLEPADAKSAKILRARAEILLGELAKPPARPRPPPSGPPRHRGAPSLAVLARGRWAARVDEVVTIELVLTSAGGPAAGLYVELGGPALSGGLVAPVQVSIGEGRGTFLQSGSGARSELRGVSLEPGYVVAPPRKGEPLPPLPPPNPTVRVQLELRGGKPGQGLLTVRVGPLAVAGTAGSALQGKNLVVEPAP